MAENALASERSDDRMRATLHNFMVAIGRLLSDDESSSIQYQLINLTILMRRVEVGSGKWVRMLKLEGVLGYLPCTHVNLCGKGENTPQAK